VLGVFSTEPYTHAKPVTAWLSFGTFVGTVLGFCYVVSMYYPDKPSAPRTFATGLDVELGASNAVHVGGAWLPAITTNLADSK